MSSTNASEGQYAINVPNAIAAQRTLMWNSIVFCVLILNDPRVFEWSLYTSPVLAGVTILHHLIILILSAKQRRNVDQESLPSAVTSRASVVFSTGLLTLFWLGSLSILLSILLWSMFKNDLEVNGRVLKLGENKLSLALTVWIIVLVLVFLVLFEIMAFLIEKEVTKEAEAADQVLVKIDGEIAFLDVVLHRYRPSSM